MKMCLRTKILYKAVKNVWRETRGIELYPGDSITFTLKYDILGTKDIIDRTRDKVTNWFKGKNK